ncbi:MAG: prepilin-type N-terminal cleavage/methylation domain-containing protein [Desulfobacterales bacterium]
MEMKHKQKHILLRGSNQGFTMIELLVGMVVSLLALAAIYSTFLAQHRSYQVQRETADMQQNIRAAMYYMQREIRMAGSNPYNSIPVFGIAAAGQNSITFTEDVRGPTAGTLDVQRSPDGDAGDPAENITYDLNGTDLRRTDNNVSPVPQVVAQNINALDFVYLDGNSAVINFDASGFIPAANLGQIRYIEITIVARTGDQLLYGTQNNKVYRNQQDDQIYVAPGDNFSRRRLSTLVNCRNLGLGDDIS